MDEIARLLIPMEAKTISRSCVVLGDESLGVRLSGPTLKATFGRGLWYEIDAAEGLLIDEYEEEEVPVEKLAAVETYVRRFATTDADSSEVGLELSAVAELLRRGQADDVSAWFIL